MAKTTRRIIPRLEAFDDRCLPSITSWTFDNGTLELAGNQAGADNIALVEENGVLTVYDNGTFWGSFSDVTFATVLTGGGNDVVSYSVVGQLTHGQTLHVELGAGNDTFNGNLNNVTV